MSCISGMVERASARNAAWSGITSFLTKIKRAEQLNEQPTYFPFLELEPRKYPAIVTIAVRSSSFD